MKVFLLMFLLLGSLTGCQSSLVQTDTSSTQRIPVSAESTKAQGELLSQTAQASSTQSCQIAAYVIDRDPQGLNVRSEPGSSRSVIGKLPTTGVISVTVDISASQGNWVQITKAESDKKVEFQGKGWVYAPLLGTSTRGHGRNGVVVYSSASNQSKVVGRIAAGSGVKLLSCQGQWSKVEYKKLTGWLAPDDQCPVAETTCS